MAIEQDITAADGYFTGEDKSLRFTISDAAGAAQDITGWSVSWMVKKRRLDPDADALLVKTTAAAGIVLTTPLSGLLTIALTDDDIVGLVGGQVYHHELKRTDPPAVLTFGRLMLNQAVHNNAAG